MSFSTKFLRVEGGAVFFFAVMAYLLRDFSLLWFVLLFFVPDLSMLGYRKNAKFGALVYNLGHTYTAPLIFILFARTLDSATGYTIGLIWVAHIGLDHALGYGLKEPDSFGHTHLGRIHTPKLLKK